jgi:phospholipid/cholesterol/gamma-HCH transport system ATP-binding protein
MELSLKPGELALIDARDADLAGTFGDLCCGLHEPVEGTVTFLRRDWVKQRRQVADALRGLIGRVSSSPGWLRFLDIETNILLPQLHHTLIDVDTRRNEATRLAIHFGLPGLPCGPVASLSRYDLVMASFVRAFLGEPKLVILESPVRGEFLNQVPALLGKIGEIRDRGGAAIWLTRSRSVWENALFPATQRLRMDYQGLTPIRESA